MPAREVQRQERSRSREPKRNTDLSHLGPAGAKDLSHLGPQATMVSKRQELEERLAKQKDAALASRGAPRRMSEEEKQRRYDAMKTDARSHEKHKERKIVAAEKHDQEVEELETQMRRGGDQSFFKDIRKSAYLETNDSMADRLKTQRHRRQKMLNDPLERND